MKSFEEAVKTLLDLCKDRRELVEVVKRRGLGGPMREEKLRSDEPSRHEVRAHLKDLRIRIIEGSSGCFAGRGPEC